MMRRLLLLLLVLAVPSWAGVNPTDPNGNPAFTDVTASCGCVAVNNEANVTLRGQSSAFVNITAYSGAILFFEGSNDGSSYFSVNAVNATTNAVATQATATGQWVADVAGLTRFRVRQTAAGSATVIVNASQGEAAVSVPLLGSPTGSAVPSTAVPVGGGAAGGTGNLTEVTVKAASTAAAATDTSMVVQPLVGNAAMVTAAAGVQRVGIAGNANGALDAANNAAAPANVIVAGAQLQSGAAATNGTAGQVGSVVAGLDHVLYARAGGPVIWSNFKEAITATTEVQAAPAAGLKAYVTSVTCSNEATTAQTVDVIFGTGANCATGATALTHKFQMGTNATTTSPFLIEATFPTPLNPTAANAICVRPSAATAFGCTVTGFIAP